MLSRGKILIVNIELLDIDTHYGDYFDQSLCVPSCGARAGASHRRLGKIFLLPPFGNIISQVREKSYRRN
jgi:hypothetical protein